MSDKLLFGCGYVGRRVAERWRDQGDRVTVVTRSAERAAALRADGFDAIVADLVEPLVPGSLPPAASVLFAVGFDRSAGRTIHEVYVEGLRHVLDALAARPAKFLYLSSTGVYGDTDGQWVDEDSPCRPTREGGRACLAAEELLWSHPLAGPAAVILRLAGIYGPGRVPRRDVLRAGEPIPAAPEGWLNLIHVEDAVEAALAAEARADTPRRYVVSDGNPGRRREYYAEMARLCGAPAPRFVDPAEGTAKAARAGADKRVSNRRLLGELGVRLRYPSYREGLAAIVAAGG